MRILLDIDGVLADWTGQVKRVVELHGGTMDITRWFKRQSLPAAIQVNVFRIIAAPGFAASLPVLPGAIEAVQQLRKAGHTVQFVTSLWNCPTWVHDRNHWLVRHKLCSAPSGVIYAKEKFMVKGDVFVDDKPENVVAWKQEWPLGVPVLWHQPWNESFNALETNINHFNDWDKLIEIVEREKMKQEKIK